MTETAASVWADRNVPVGAIAEQCKAYAASGAVDGVLIPDQLANFIPAQLWTPQNTPLAAMMSDPDSMMDAFMVAPYIAAAAPELALHVTTDSVRRPPAELIQSMLTLAHITEGKATFQIGGGELKQTKPFGHPTNQGMSRMKDLFSMYEKFLTSDKPFDFEGRRRTLQGAFLGSAMQHKPMVWGLGGGPQLLDYTATWADGMAIAVPNAWTSPEAAERGVFEIRRKVEEKGRDPAKFRIGLWAVCLMHDDERQLQAALDNPILKFVCGAMGRVETDQWQADGHDPLPFPEGWAYYKDLLPYAMDDAFVDDVVAAVTPEHQRAGFFVGDAAQVADQIKPYVDAAGADWVCGFDYLPVVGDPADAAAAAGRTIELCRRIKEMA